MSPVDRISCITGVLWDAGPLALGAVLAVIALYYVVTRFAVSQLDGSSGQAAKPLNLQSPRESFDFTALAIIKTIEAVVVTFFTIYLVLIHSGLSRVEWVGLQTFRDVFAICKSGPPAGRLRAAPVQGQEPSFPSTGQQGRVEAAVVRVLVLPDGTIEVDGRPATVVELQSAIRALPATRGAVVYHRVGPYNPETDRLGLTLLEQKVPVFSSNRRDFSDYLDRSGRMWIDADGHPRRRP